MRGGVAVVQPVVVQNVPTLLVGGLSQQGPVGRHELTAEGRIGAGTVCIVAV